ncbi:PREDICTED: protein FAM117A isoform X2 [Thamnophis sirtalis]|uniref:Protein FAM117A isoform X2 n=1 Tax=Thamnophis sirtalis TaxID=35019 RepID=A0A6I9Z0V3_9SAUR|nr:PREDICTED: protein FAM117A isoform X2 [Thamnophis sirtalis]
MPPVRFFVLGPSRPSRSCERPVQSEGGGAVRLIGNPQAALAFSTRAMAAGTSSSCWVGLQPLKSTFPFQLQSRRNGDGDRAASVPWAAGSERTSRNRPPRAQHTSSLDTILDSYLMGQWPRDAEGLPLSHMSDKSTQIAKLKQQLQRTKLAVWNSKEKDQSFSTQGNHSMAPSTKGTPFASFPAPSTVSSSSSLHNSLESINQELEEIFVKEQGDEELLRVLEVPDGHRAPLPFQRNTEDSWLPRLENNSSPCSSLSLSPSPSDGLQQSSPSPTRMITDEDLPRFLAKLVLENKGRENGSTSPDLSFALSPHPNHTYVFKREPPEGCEKIHASEEVVPDQPVLPSCPDKNKVYFKPTGSAFCQFSLVKPLIPKVNIPYRDFSSSPNPKSSGTFPSCQATTAVPILTLQKDLSGDNFSENPKSPSLGLESWKRHQPEDAALFHSSVAV